MDYCPPSSLCQRPHQPPASCSDWQRQPSKGWQGTWGVEATANQLLLHLQQNVDQGQERICADYYECGEDCADEHVGYLLILREMRGLEWSTHISMYIFTSWLRFTICCRVSFCLRLTKLPCIELQMHEPTCITFVPCTIKTLLI